jgi:hypothetical protein
MSDLQDNERRLQMELDQVKQERDKKIVDNQRNLDKDRETYKQKLLDAE